MVATKEASEHGKKLQESKQALSREASEQFASVDFTTKGIRTMHTNNKEGWPLTDLQEFLQLSKTKSQLEKLNNSSKQDNKKEDIQLQQ